MRRKAIHCPFCGGKSTHRIRDKQFLVVCYYCHVTISRPTRIESLNAWDSRVPQTYPQNPDSCPCCGHNETTVSFHEVMEPGWNANDTLAQHVTCDNCGLTMAGMRPHYGQNFSIVRVDAVKAWRQRRTPEEYQKPDAIWDAERLQAHENLRTRAIEEMEKLNREKRKFAMRMRSDGKKLVISPGSEPKILTPMPGGCDGSIGASFGMVFTIEDAAPGDDLVELKLP